MKNFLEPPDNQLDLALVARQQSVPFTFRQVLGDEPLVFLSVAGAFARLAGTFVAGDLRLVTCQLLPMGDDHLLVADQVFVVFDDPQSQAGQQRQCLLVCLPPTCDAVKPGRVFSVVSLVLSVYPFVTRDIHAALTLIRMTLTSTCARPGVSQEQNTCHWPPIGSGASAVVVGSERAKSAQSARFGTLRLRFDAG